MKKCLRNLIIFLGIIISLIVLVIFSIYDKNNIREISNTDNDVFSIDINDIHTINLSNADVEAFLNCYLLKHNNSNTLFTGTKVEIKKENTLSIKCFLNKSIVPTSFSGELKFAYSKGTIYIKLLNCKVGKVNIPKNIASIILKDNIESWSKKKGITCDFDSKSLILALEVNEMISKKQDVFNISDISTKEGALFFDIEANFSIPNLIKNKLTNKFLK